MTLPRFSIIIPVYNGNSYLPGLMTKLQNYQEDDFEVIVSDGKSSDGSWETLQKISDPRILKFQTPSRMSMAEHWEWAAEHASGQWQMFLGQDDFLQDYFFEHAKDLTEFAESLGIRAVIAKRAFLNWPGLTEPPKNQILFGADDSIEIRKSKTQTALALTSVRSYHSLPQMYTSSLFSFDLLNEIRRRQKGQLIVCHPQDASLAASFCLTESKYIYSGIPLSWVGTSPKSAGKAVISAANQNVNRESVELANDYRDSISSSGLRYPTYAGDFFIGDNAIYFWQALREVRSSRGENVGILSSKLLLGLIISMGFARIAFLSRAYFTRISFLRSLTRENGLSRSWLFVISVVPSSFLHVIILIIRRTLEFRGKVLNDRGAENTILVPYSEHPPDLHAVNRRAMSIWTRLTSDRG